MDRWKIIRKPLDVEADIPLKDEAPPEIKSKYENLCKSEFFAWGLDNGSLCGCIRSGRSVQVNAEKTEILELCEMESAKGCGYVSLEARSKDSSYIKVIATSRYSNKSLLWLKEVQSELVDFFALEQSYRYCGKDA